MSTDRTQDAPAAKHDPRDPLFDAVERVNNAYIKRQSEALASIARSLSSQVRIDHSAIARASRMISESMDSLQQALRVQLTQEVQRVTSQIAKTINDILEPMHVSDQITRMLPPSFEDAIAHATESLKWVDAHDEWERAANEYATIMIEAEWPPILDIPSSSIFEIVADSKSMSPDRFKQEITSLIIDFYDETQLRQKLADWGEVPLLKRRYRILRDVIDAHILEKYNLSVPVALIQMEGFLGDISSHKGRMKATDVEKYLTALFTDRAVTSPFDRVKFLILNNVLARFEWGKDISGTISRHAIVHGADTQYGTRAASLKCILLFDYLVYYYKKMKDRARIKGL